MGMRVYLQEYGSKFCRLGRWYATCMEVERESERGITPGMKIPLNSVGGRSSGIRHTGEDENKVRRPEDTRNIAADR